MPRINRAQREHPDTYEGNTGTDGYLDYPVEFFEEENELDYERVD